MPTFYSIVDYVGNGSTATYAVPFPFMTTTHVEVYVGGVRKTVNTDYTWPNLGQITFNSAPASSASIRIKRHTPMDKMLTAWFGGSQILSLDLNNASLQLLYIIQEFVDWREEILNDTGGTGDTGVVSFNAITGIRWNPSTGRIEYKYRVISAPASSESAWTDMDTDDKYIDV